MLDCVHHAKELLSWPVWTNRAIKTFAAPANRGHGEMKCLFGEVSQVKGYAAVFSKAVIIICYVISAFEGIELGPLSRSLDCLCLVLLINAVSKRHTLSYS